MNFSRRRWLPETVVNATGQRTGLHIAFFACWFMYLVATGNMVVGIRVMSGIWPGSADRWRRIGGNFMARPFLLFLLFGAGFCAASNGMAAEISGKGYLVFGFVPALSARYLVSRFQPLADYLGDSLGIEVRLETAPSFRDFLNRAIGQRRYDIMFAAGNLYHQARQEAQYRAILRVGKLPVRALVVSLKSSGIGDLAGLAGRRVATLERLALSDVLGRYLLNKAGLRPGRDLSMQVTPNQNAALLSVLQGSADAAIIIEPAYTRASALIKGKLRVLSRSREFPHHPISVAPWVGAALAEKVAKALLALAATPSGRAMVRRTGWPGFVRAKPDDYDAAMRRMSEGAGE